HTGKKKNKTKQILPEVKTGFPCLYINCNSSEEGKKQFIAAERHDEFPQHILKTLPDITFLMAFLSSWFLML
ncbi:hypothetical protein, partial [Salmonella sp. gx-f5]|uniref:hypothetical protein n=1 Tax=Salmonella sp. gx-f5 TaxID=2582605 RepID=UPI001F20690D